MKPVKQKNERSTNVSDQTPTPAREETRDAASASQRKRSPELPVEIFDAIVKHAVPATERPGLTSRRASIAPSKALMDLRSVSREMRTFVDRWRPEAKDSVASSLAQKIMRGAVAMNAPHVKEVLE